MAQIVIAVSFHVGEIKKSCLITKVPRLFALQAELVLRFIEFRLARYRFG
jgi:hypothetical protein